MKGGRSERDLHVALPERHELLCVDLAQLHEQAVRAVQAEHIQGFPVALLREDGPALGSPVYAQRIPPNLGVPAISRLWRKHRG